MTRQIVNAASELLAMVRKGRFEFSEDQASLLATLIETSINEFQEMVGIRWIALATGISERAIQNLAKLGKIPGAKQCLPGVKGSHYKFEKSAVVAWMQERAA